MEIIQLVKIYFLISSLKQIRILVRIFFVAHYVKTGLKSSAVAEQATVALRHGFDPCTEQILVWPTYNIVTDLGVYVCDYTRYKINFESGTTIKSSTLHILV